MAGSFVAPSASPKMRSGKPNRPKSCNEDATGLSAQPRDYAITDSFASKSIPDFGSRKVSSHTKSGFNSKPLRSSKRGF
jgi:hypothetical protein